MIEALADGGVKMGLPRALAQELATQTIVGAGRMVQQTGMHPAQLRDNVTSPAGSTAAGLHHLEKNGNFYLLLLSYFFFPLSSVTFLLSSFSSLESSLLILLSPFVSSFLSLHFCPLFPVPCTTAPYITTVGN